MTPDPCPLTTDHRKLITPDQRHRACIQLVHDQLGGRGQLVGDGDHGDVQIVARRVSLTTVIGQGGNAGYADGDVDDAVSPRPAEAGGSMAGNFSDSWGD